MNRGFSYIEILISIALIGILIVSSSYTIISIIKLKKRILYYNEFHRFLNLLYSRKEIKISEKKIKNIKIKIKKDEDGNKKLIIIKDPLSNRKFYIYFSGIINL